MCGALRNRRICRRRGRTLRRPTGGEFDSYLSPDRPHSDRLTDKVGERQGGRSRPFFLRTGPGHLRLRNREHDLRQERRWMGTRRLCACNVKKGNCTDFHSLFIAIARSRGIPARFTIGFPLGASSAGQIPGYHCWAEFYTGGQWVPVHASEAWKHPQLRNYYFGHLDADRIPFTMAASWCGSRARAGNRLTS
jgi:hypothetical protein